MIDTVKAMFEQGGLTFIIILLMSVLALTVGIERWAAMHIARRRMSESTERILGHLRERNRTMALAVNSTLAQHPGAKLFELLLADRQVTAGEIRRMQSRIIRGTKTRLWVLGTIGATAPFVGLLGTVIGILQAFNALGVAAGTNAKAALDPSHVMTGVGEALVATAVGLAVAIPAIVAFNVLQRVVKSALDDAQTLALEVVAYLEGKV